MSIAGIRSNRGDGYQTQVAFDWALIVLSEPDYQWIEIDSTAHGVDDVVVGKADGTTISTAPISRRCHRRSTTAPRRCSF